MAVLDYRKLLSKALVYLIIFVLNLIDYTNCGFQRTGNQHNSLIGPTTAHPLSSVVHPKWNEPYFDLMMPTNVTALVGKSAYLSCRVKNLGNRTVSWIRHRDIHILTVVTYTYTTDQRFQTTHHKDTDEWTLHIKWAQLRDAGMYECQVSTIPIKSYSVYLNVVEPYRGEGGGFYGSSYRPYHEENSFNKKSKKNFYDKKPNQYDNFEQKTHDSSDYDSSQDIYGRMYSDKFHVPTATILGGPDMYVDKSSTINLTCTIKFSPEPPAYIFWYHEELVISYESIRGGVTIMSDILDPTISYLLIKNADLGDTGKYTCAPSNAPATSIKVHVLNGERPEAMQTSGSSDMSVVNGIINKFNLILLHIFINLIYFNFNRNLIFFDFTFFNLR